MRWVGKIVLIWIIFLVSFYGIDQAAWMFNHPWFRGEDGLAVLVAFFISFFALIAARLILFNPQPVPKEEGHD